MEDQNFKTILSYMKEFQTSLGDINSSLKKWKEGKREEERGFKKIETMKSAHQRSIPFSF